MFCEILCAGAGQRRMSFAVGSDAEGGEVGVMYLIVVVRGRESEVVCWRLGSAHTG